MADKTERERGTPALCNNPLKHPRVLLSVIVIICTVLSVLACGTDLANRQALLSTTVGAAMGSISALVGVITADSSTHGVAFGLAVLVSSSLSFVMETNGSDDLLQSLVKSLLPAAAPLAVGIMTKFPPIRKMLAVVTRALINPLVISVIASIPILSFVAGAILLTLQESVVSNVVPALLGVAALVLYLIYFKNRNHKHGSLLNSQARGVAVATACAMACTVQMAYSTMMLPILLGSLMTTLLCAVFGCVADTWYAVGTGQFLMVSLDTAGLLLYFVAPIVVLLVRFVDQYGEGLHQSMVSVVKTLFGRLEVSDLECPVKDIVTSGVLLVVASGTMLGVPLVNALCPLGAQLFGWVYTHGQPNTKRIALCVSMSDLVVEENAKDNNKEIQSLLDKLVVKDQESVAAALNIFVSYQDLIRYPEMVKSCAMEGHCIGIVGGGDLEKALHEYTKVLKLQPQWCSVGCSNTSIITQTAKLGLKIAYWSTRIDITDMDKLVHKDMNKIQSDVMEINGGSIIYLNGNKVGSNDMSRAICHIIQELSVKNDSDKDGYKFLPLSLVAREGNHMEL